MKLVKVACHVPNGIMIRRYKAGFDDGTGDNVKPMVHEGAAVRLNGTGALQTGAGSTHRDDIPPGITEIDAEWWAAWLGENAGNPLVTGKYIFAIKEDDEEPTANPTP
jgi:hypothetical protein